MWLSEKGVYWTYLSVNNRKEPKLTTIWQFELTFDSVKVWQICVKVWWFCVKVWEIFVKVSIIETTSFYKYL